jgi:hypothetical protein
MAVTVALVTQTPNRLRYLLTADAEGGAAAPIAAATLLADCISGPLKEMPGIGSDIAGLTQALARRQLLGQGAAGGVTDLTNTQHAACKLTSRSGATVWNVDADVDAVNALRGELNVVASGAVGVAILEVEFQHTLVR